MPECTQELPFCQFSMACAFFLPKKVSFLSQSLPGTSTFRRQDLSYHLKPPSVRFQLLPVLGDTSDSSQLLLEMHTYKKVP